jgi:hypothetical protein
MTVTVNVHASTSVAAAGHGRTIHICLSGSSNNLARAVAEFNTATAG